MSDARQHAPATARNREPILAVLRDVLPAAGLVLEIASGTGEHAVHFARALPAITWQPSDPDADARASIAAWTSDGTDEEAGEGSRRKALANLVPPLALDAASVDWPVARADAIVCINMIHISPWESTLGLMAGAGRVLESGAPLVLYGPYRREGHLLEPSNAAFDADLRRRNGAWGLRSLEDVAQVAADNGLALERVIAMPANNLAVVFSKR